MSDSTLSLDCFSYAMLQKAKWQELEQFSIDVLSEYYRPFGLSVIRTRKKPGGADGARDGDARFILAGEHTPLDQISPSNPDLGVVITLWVEVKQRSKDRINHHDVGGTIFSSLSRPVTKLIFVTNLGFTKPFQKELESFALRYSRQFSLIDGRGLVKMARGLTRSRKLGESTAQTAYSNIDAKISLALEPRAVSPKSKHSKLESSVGDPVFLIADCSVGEMSNRFARFSVDLEFVGKGSPKIISRAGKVQPAISSGDSFRAEFLVYPDNPGDLRSDQFALKIWDEKGFEINPKIGRRKTTCRVYGTILPNTIPRSRQVLYRQIVEKIEAWNRSLGAEAIDLIAIAGAGKSHLVRYLRPVWNEDACQEVFLDGGKESKVNEAAMSLLRQIFPLPMEELRPDLAESIIQWLVRTGISQQHAETFGRLLCDPSLHGTLPFPEEFLGRVLALVLAERSVDRSIVVVFEDLHKCTPSLISLLKLIRQHLKDLRKSKVLTVFTSREDSVWNDEAVRENWRITMNSMRTGAIASEFHIQSLTVVEAKELIKESILCVEDHYVEEIIQQIGTTPFAIREAIGLLLERKALSPSGNNGLWMLTDPDVLQGTLYSSHLKKATHYRLCGLFERHPEWLSDFMNSGACIGPMFDQKLVATNAGAPRSVSFEKALAECRALEIIRPSATSANDVRFDHDLIRSVLLEDIGVFRQRRLAKGLLELLDKERDFGLLASLSYQAGLAEKCWEYSLKQANRDEQAKRHLEVVQDLGLALAVTDNNLASKIFDVRDSRYRPSFDEAIAVAEPTFRADLSRENRERETTTLLLKYIQNLVKVGSGGSPTVSQALTEGLMLAEKLNDRFLKASFTMYHGRLEFNQDKPLVSLELHKKAEELFVGLDQHEEINRQRAINLVRLAIGLRSSGQLSESRSTLIQALKLRWGLDWDLATQVRSNFGATYFYLDWTKTRHHWEKATQIAARADITYRFVHGLIDIASLDLLEDKSELAKGELNYAFELSREYGLENSELRCLLNLGCLSLMQNDPLNALEYLRDADRLGFRHQIGRRLWRVRSNMATAYFLLGQSEQSVAMDKVVLNSLSMVLENFIPNREEHLGKTRMILALVNIALRARISPAYVAIMKELPSNWNTAIEELADAALNDRLEFLKGMLFRHYKQMTGNKFFVITE